MTQQSDVRPSYYFIDLSAAMTTEEYVERFEKNGGLRPTISTATVKTKRKRKPK